MTARFLLSPVYPPRSLPRYLRRSESMYLISQVESATKQGIVASYSRAKDQRYGRDECARQLTCGVVHRFMAGAMKLVTVLTRKKNPAMKNGML